MIVTGTEGMGVALDTGVALAVGVRADPPPPAQAAKPLQNAAPINALRMEIVTVGTPKSDHYRDEPELASAPRGWVVSSFGFSIHRSAVCHQHASHPKEASEENHR